MPTTRPLFLLNHLVATVAAKLKPKIPDAEPRHTPIPSSKCHFSETEIHINKPDIIKILEIIITFGKPILSIKAPPKGASEANIININADAEVTSEIFHPKDSVNGMISTCGVLTAAEDEIVVRKAITAITHP